jgi:hypothetical protein
MFEAVFISPEFFTAELCNVGDFKEFFKNPFL